MHMDYELHLPESLNDALALLAETDGKSTALLAGGTNLIVDMRADRETPDRVISLDRVDGLRDIKEADGVVSIGGGTTVSDLMGSDLIADSAPSLIDAAKAFAGQMVRNTATVAGNIACGSPAADLVPPLLSLDAKVTLTSLAGDRNLPLDGYFTGYKTDQSRADEVITQISWPRRKVSTVNSFYKLARRKGDAITITGVAVTVSAEGGVCTTARMALGAVAPTVFRAHTAEAHLEGEALTEALIEEAAKLAGDATNPIDDVRASAAYRRHTAQALTRRLLADAWAKLA